MKKILFFIIFILLVFISFSKNNILILSSYSPDYLWTMSTIEGIRSVFKDNDNVIIYEEYMDTKKFTRKDHILNLYSFYKEKYKNINIDYVIALDDSAVSFIIDYGSIFKYKKVFFTGVNNDLLRKEAVERNFQGIFSEFSVKKNIDLIKLVSPQVKTIILVNDDKTETSAELEKEFDSVALMYKDISFIKINNLSHEELKNYFASYDRKTYILLGLYLTDKDGIPMKTSDIIKILDDNKVNYNIMWDFYQYGNFTAGYVTSGFSLGKKLAELIENPETFPDDFYFTIPGDYIINYKEYKIKNISLKNTDFSYKFVNTDVPFLEEYRDEIAVFTLISIIILSFIIHLFYSNHSKNNLIKTINSQKDKLIELNKDTENKYNELNTAKRKLDEVNYDLKQNQKIINQIIDSTDDLIFAKDSAGVILFANKKFAYYYNLRPQDIIGVSHYTLENYILSKSLNKIISQDQYVLKNNKTLMIPGARSTDINGNIRYYRIKKSSILLNGKNCILTTGTDITDIKESQKKIDYHISDLLKTNKKLKEMISQNESLLTNLNKSYINFASKLAMVAESHDEDTGNHIQRVGELSYFIAEKMNFSKEFCEEIKIYAPLHDIGKIFIPSEIIKKTGPLSPEEWDLMKKHTSLAYKFLGNDFYLKTALNIALYHHEKFDGSGYPFGLKGNSIPVEAQIVSLVDVYDALRSKRSYKKAYSHEKAYEIIIKGDGRTNPFHFRPEMLEIFITNSEKIKNLWDNLNL